MPISALIMHMTDWRFKARVLKKTKREYKNEKNAGTIMNLDLIDSLGTMI